MAVSVVGELDGLVVEVVSLWRAVPRAVGCPCSPGGGGWVLMPEESEQPWISPAVNTFQHGLPDLQRRLWL